MKQLSLLVKVLLFWALLIVIGILAYHIGADNSLSLSLTKMPPESFSWVVILALLVSLLTTFFNSSLRKKFRK
ncbi:MAG: hypothetical protein B7Y00_07665 [Sphingomonadales bacterium 17-56-6]|nr:MAG: hypothetical protein B7Y44_03410 [Sphingomonadales bacterium 28-55-16]OYZ85586.1 MAG: hypothetical protein B7Y00_07665 [Sphingomonadales bacterium 17-56-6]